MVRMIGGPDVGLVFRSLKVHDRQHINFRLFIITIDRDMTKVGVLQQVAWESRRDW